MFKRKKKATLEVSSQVHLGLSHLWFKTMLNHIELALWLSLGGKIKKEEIKLKPACLLRELSLAMFAFQVTTEVRHFGFPRVISEVVPHLISI